MGIHSDLINSEQSDPPDSVENYVFKYYKKVVQPGPITIRKWRFYKDGKVWLVDNVYGKSETVKGNAQKGEVIYHIRLKIVRGERDIAYMSLD